MLLPCICFAAQEVQTTKGLAKKIRKDVIVQSLFDEQLEREERRIIKNRSIVKKLEQELTESRQTGKLEDEVCIRRNISALRTIDYTYDWVLDQISQMSGERLRLVMFNDLERIRYINKRFSLMNMEIEECKLKNRRRSVGEGREMFKDVMDDRVESLKKGVNIPEDYRSTRAPFK